MTVGRQAGRELEPHFLLYIGFPWISYASLGHYWLLQSGRTTTLLLLTCRTTATRIDRRWTIESTIVDRRSTNNNATGSSRIAFRKNCSRKIDFQPRLLGETMCFLQLVQTQRGKINNSAVHSVEKTRGDDVASTWGYHYACVIKK